MTFVDKTGVAHPAAGYVGQNLVHVAHANNIDLEGACECSLACSTCHVILEEGIFNKLEAPTEEEEDLLDVCGSFDIFSSHHNCSVLCSWLSPQQQREFITPV